jgi:hypothetical protein
MLRILDLKKQMEGHGVGCLIKRKESEQSKASGSKITPPAALSGFHRASTERQSFIHPSSPGQGGCLWLEGQQRVPTKMKKIFFGAREQMRCCS